MAVVEDEAVAAAEAEERPAWTFADEGAVVGAAGGAAAAPASSTVVTAMRLLLLPEAE